MKISVIGGGSWGTTLGDLLSRSGHEVTIWARELEVVESINHQHINNLFLPGAPLTRDQWKMLQRDNLPATKSQGLEAFGLEPTALEAVAPDWLQRFRQGGRWSSPVAREVAPAS